MQLTNGAIKKTSTISMPPNAMVVKEEEGVDELDTFDLSAFVIPSKQKSNLAIRPSDKEKKSQEIEKFLAESTELFNLGQQYETEVVARGHKALYELLASIYSLALRIEEHELAEKIVEAIRRDLKEKHDIKLQTNSTPLAAIVRYVVRSDKLVASRYTKVLTVAREENLSPEELPAYITRRGGVTQVQETEAKALSKKEGDKNSKERTAMLREYFELTGYISKESLKFNGEVIVHNSDKGTAAETSSFCVFVAHYESGQDYKIITANDLGHTYEENLIKYLGKDFPSDLYVLERGLRNYKRKITMDSTVPEGLRRKLTEELALPMKHKQQVVIEMKTETELVKE